MSDSNIVKHRLTEAKNTLKPDLEWISAGLYQEFTEKSAYTLCEINFIAWRLVKLGDIKFLLQKDIYIWRYFNVDIIEAIYSHLYQKKSDLAKANQDLSSFDDPRYRLADVLRQWHNKTYKPENIDTDMYKYLPEKLQRDIYKYLKLQIDLGKTIHQKYLTICSLLEIPMSSQNHRQNKL